MAARVLRCSDMYRPVGQKVNLMRLVGFLTGGIFGLVITALWSGGISGRRRLKTWRSTYNHRRVHV